MPNEAEMSLIFSKIELGVMLLFPFDGRWKTENGNLRLEIENSKVEISGERTQTNQSR